MTEVRQVLTLYSRSYCHLCEDMLLALQTAFGQQYVLDIRVLDIDLAAHATLLADYDELVPVLIGLRKGVETRLCHYFLDHDRVAAWLAA